MLRIALCQMRVVANKGDNLTRAAELIRDAVRPAGTPSSVAVTGSATTFRRFTRDEFGKAAPSGTPQQHGAGNMPVGSTTTKPEDRHTNAVTDLTTGPPTASATSTAQDHRTSTSGQRSSVVVVLPECFNSPYGTKFFAEYAEPLPPVGTTADRIDAKSMPSCSAMANLAKELGLWIVAGSIPEVSSSSTSAVAESSAPSAGSLRRYHNTSFVLDPSGTVRALYRKMHLFKIDTPTLKMDEAEVLTAGDAPQTFTVPTIGSDFHPSVIDTLASQGLAEEAAAKIGLGICFDVRYPQLALHYRDLGTQIIVYPAAFNMVTGPTHWELAARSRAVDAQQFVVMCSPARDTTAGYVAFGQSIIIDPAGGVVARAGTSVHDCGDECIVTADIDLGTVAAVRARLPIMAGTRRDLYELRFY